MECFPGNPRLASEHNRNLMKIAHFSENFQMQALRLALRLGIHLAQPVGCNTHLTHMIKREGGCIQTSPKNIVLMFFDVIILPHRPMLIPNQLIQATLFRPPRIATSLALEHQQHVAAVTGEASSMTGDRRTVPPGQEKVSQVAL